MKRLHIVGKSPDNRRLYLARAKGAKFGSFEVPISPKLLKLVREAEDARRPKDKAGVERTDEAGPVPTPATPAEATPAEAAPEPAQGAARAEPKAAGSRKASPPKAARPASVPEAPAGRLQDDTSVRVVRRTRRATDASAERSIAAGDDIPLGPRRRPEPSEEPAEAGARVEDKPRATRGRRRPEATGDETPAPPEQTAPQRPPVTPRTKRPQIPARSKLTPAEIQALIRAGRTVRSVAQLAGTPAEWVKWLAEPVQQERRAIVANALRERQTRSRLGASAEPLGTSVALNLRSRGVSGSDRVVEEGFTAVRSNGREWRVRLSFEHRGRRTSAVWGYDPQRHAITPLNTLAAQLGWRRPRSAAASAEPNGGDADLSPRTAAPSRRKAAAAKTTSSRGRPSARVSARRSRSR